MLLHDSLHRLQFSCQADVSAAWFGTLKENPKNNASESSSGLNGAAPLCPTFRREREGSGCVRKKGGARTCVCVCGQRWPLKYILVAGPATAAQVPRRKRTPPLDSQYNRRQNWQSADFFFCFSSPDDEFPFHAVTLLEKVHIQILSN